MRAGGAGGRPRGGEALKKQEQQQQQQQLPQRTEDSVSEVRATTTGRMPGSWTIYGSLCRKLFQSTVVRGWGLGAGSGGLGVGGVCVCVGGGGGGGGGELR